MRLLKLLRASALALLTAAIAVPANAITFYFVGSEDIGFTIVGTVLYQGGSTYDSNFTRGSLEVNNSTTVADPPANRFTTPTFTAVSSLWIHASIWADNSGSTNNEQTLIIRSPDGVGRVYLRQSGTGTTLKLSTANAARTFSDKVTFSSFTASALHKLDLFVPFTCSGGDVAIAYIDGVSIGSYTGSLCTDSATTLNEVEFSGISNSSSGFPSNWSEIIIASSDTRGLRLWNLAPVAAGNTQSFTPNTVGDVNPTTANDAAFVTTGTNNALSEWTTPTTAPSGAWNVLAIVQEARVERGSTGPQNFDFLMRTKDGTDHLGGYSSSVTTSFQNFSSFIWTTNPHTSAAFVTSDIASGFNLGIESLP